MALYTTRVGHYMHWYLLKTFQATLPLASIIFGDGIVWLAVGIIRVLIAIIAAWTPWTGPRRLFQRRPPKFSEKQR